MTDAPSFPQSGPDGTSPEDWVVIVPPFGVPGPPPPITAGGFPQGQPGYPTVGGSPIVPSRTLTVVITALFGPFGMIPAQVHGQQAEAVGAPSGRYWKAFGVTLGVTVAAHAAIWTLLFVVVLGGVGPVVSYASGPVTTPTTEAPGTTQPSTAAPAVPAPSNLLWDASRIEAALDTFTDDEAGDWAAFNRQYVVVIPCGGEGVYGAAPDLLQSTNGGSQYMATAELLPTAASAQREVERLSALLDACGPFDIVAADDGELLAHCEAPIVASLGPVIRYEEVCDNAPGNPQAFAIFQANNAVVALMAPTAGALDAMLPTVMAQLDALSAGQVLDAAAAERDIAAQFEAREGVAIDLECDDDMLASLGATYQCRGTTARGHWVVLYVTITSEDPIAYTWTER